MKKNKKIKGNNNWRNFIGKQLKKLIMWVIAKPNNFTLAPTNDCHGEKYNFLPQDSDPIRYI